MAAGVTADACEAAVRIAALDEALNHLPFDRTPQPPRALPQRTRSRIARPIAVACGRWARVARAADDPRKGDRGERRDRLVGPVNLDACSLFP